MTELDPMTEPRPHGRRRAAFILVLPALVALACASAPPWQPALAPLGPGPAGEDAAAPRTPAIPPAGPLAVSLADAVFLALENNPSVLLARLGPGIYRSLEETERAAFDPVAGADASWRWSKTERLARFGSGTEQYGSETDSLSGWGSLHLPWGTDVALEGRMSRTVSSLYSDPFSETRLGVTVTQALLEGFGPAVNLARLDQARIDTQSSQYELRGFAAAMVAQVERAYWTFALAAREVEIVRESLALAEQQERETEERIKIGRLPETERAAARAQTALRREDLIRSEAAEDLARLELAGLMGLPPSDFGRRVIRLTEGPKPPPRAPDAVEDHVLLAQKLRPEVNQAKLAIRRQGIEVVKTRNGLLPVLDAFLTLGKTGYASSFFDSAGMLAGPSHDVAAGVSFQFPVFRRAASAGHQRARVNQRIAEEALANLERTVELDVRSAHIAARSAREQITATRATRTLREEALRAELEKFRVGRSTTYLVGQAERDLLESRIAEVRAVVATLLADLELHRLDGSLLQRRSIAAPGAKAVE